MAKLIELTKDVYPHRKGHEMLFADAIADKFVKDGLALVKTSFSNEASAPASKASSDQPLTFREKIQHAIPVGYRKKG